MLTPEIRRENGKLGGRPKGSKTGRTLEKEKVQAAVNDRIFKIADSLVTAQVSLSLNNGKSNNT